MRAAERLVRNVRLGGFTAVERCRGELLIRGLRGPIDIADWWWRGHRRIGSSVDDWIRHRIEHH